MSEKFFYQCITCGKEITTDKVVYLCPNCEKKNKQGQPPVGVLKVIYDYKNIRDKHSPVNLFEQLKDDSFIDLMPIDDVSSIPGLKIGNTPIYEIDTFEGRTLNTTLLVKNEARNPTLSVKDRASVVVSAFARQNEIDTLLIASSGNAGSSAAGVCAAHGQKAIIIIPDTAPLEKVIQTMMYGARLVPVKGSYDEAFDLSIQITKKTGIYNRNIAYNPLVIEGMKTIAFEIYEQLDGALPDNIFIPVGDGGIISAVYKGFEELLKLNIIETMPTIVAVQAVSSPNLVDNLTKNTFSSVKSSTLADSIAVDIPRNFYMTVKYMKQYGGEAVKVTDDEILDASLKLARNTGIFAEPSASAAFAGFLNMYERGAISETAVNLVLLTGSGMKDIAAVEKILNLPTSLPCDADEIIKAFGL